MVDASAYDTTATTVTSGVMTGLAVLCTALRFYVRVHLKAGIAWDDWWILAGLFSYLLAGGLLLWGKLARVNVDPLAEKAISEAIFSNTASTFDTSPHTTYLKLSFICTVLYFSCVSAVKISILLMYRRIFSIDTSFRLQSLVVGIVVLAFWVAASIATVFNCHPIEHNWVGLVLAEHCFNYNIFWMVTGAVEVVIDTVILALPVRMVLGLRVSSKQKASIVLIFLLGSFVIVTGIVRVVYGYIPGSRAPEYSKSGLWSTVHIIMGIICACLPTLRPLFARFSSMVSTTSSAVRRKYQGLSGQDYRKGTGLSDSGIGSRTGDAIEIFPLRRPDGRSDVSLKAPHTDTQAVHPRRQECHCDAGLRNAHAEIEAVPRERQDCSCNASLNDEGLGADEIHAVTVAASRRRGKDCVRCGSIKKDTRVEIQSEPIRPQECYCGASLNDPRTELVWLDRERGW